MALELTPAELLFPLPTRPQRGMTTKGGVRVPGRAWKIVAGHDYGSIISGHGKGRSRLSYTVGEQVEAPESRGIYALTTYALAHRYVELTFKHMREGTYELTPIVELAYEEDDVIAQPLWGFGTIRLARCTVIGEAPPFSPDNPRSDDAPYTPHVRPDMTERLDRIAQLRADAILAGQRQRPHPATTDPLDQLVRKKVAAARRKARRAA